MVRAAELSRERPPGWSNDEHFPAPLVQTVIDSYTDLGDRVLDPFAGSGTTLAVAERLGRHAVGVELLADRVDFIRGRIDTATVVHGDARSLDQLVSGAFELCLTSPPYMTKSQHPQNPLTGYRTMDGDYGRYLEDLGDVFESVSRLLTPEGTFVLNVANLRNDAGITPLADDLTRVVARHFTVLEAISVRWDEQPGWLVEDRLVILRPAR